MEEPEVNIYEVAARNMKAAKLAVVLARAGFTGTEFDHVNWESATTLAKVNPPSDTTKELVMELLAN